MPSPKQILREFASVSKLSTTGWTIAGVDGVLLIRDIPDVEHARCLAEFLDSQGFAVTISTANKQGTLWAVFARQAIEPSWGDAKWPSRSRSRSLS